MNKKQNKLFFVIQNNNAFDENYFEGYLWARDHVDANEKAKIKYPDGYLVFEIQYENLKDVFLRVEKYR